ncbi:MAG: ferritin-like domain-containing protein [Burkholderiaceae bacterium]
MCLDEPVGKVNQTHALCAACNSNGPDRAWVDPIERFSAPVGSHLPGRPPRLTLIPPTEVPQRSPFTPEGLAALVHAICHIEFNAINLALDAVWRFGGMPQAFYSDWIRVADEEATHFGLLHTHLQSLGHVYGDLPAHDGLWEMCLKTQDDVTARMALVPRTLEARGLDATPLIQARLRKVNSPDALRVVEILDIILRDEIGHVAVGNRWYGWLCAQQGLDPLAHYRLLARRHKAPRLKPPFNTEARLRAGFSQPEIEALGEA